MDKFISTLLCCLLLFSCAKDELADEHHDAYVYRERTADFPLINGRGSVCRISNSSLSIGLIFISRVPIPAILG